MGPDFTYYLNSSRPLKNFLYFLKKHRIKKTQPEKISYQFPAPCLKKKQKNKKKKQKTKQNKNKNKTKRTP